MRIRFFIGVSFQGATLKDTAKQCTDKLTISVDMDTPCQTSLSAGLPLCEKERA